MINPKITGNYISLSPLVNTMGAGLPLDWANVFGRNALIEVEIGFGLGDFLVRAALQCPEKNIIGIESGWPMVKRALRKIALAGAPNVRLLLADARTAIEFFFGERSISRLYSLFPCPWPKQRHERNRLFQSDFLRLLNGKMADSGTLTIVTDHRAYLEWIEAQVPGTGFSFETEKVPPSYGTKYERKWQESGKESFFRIKLLKIKHLAPLDGKDTILISRIVKNFNPQALSLRGLRGSIMVEPKEFLFDPLRSRGMVRVVVSEDSLLQDIWIEIVLRERGWHIKPSKGSSFIPTKGVQAALDHIRILAEESAESIISANRDDLP